MEKKETKKNLQFLIDKGYELYGNQGSNEVYKLGEDVKLYNPLEDEVLCSWNLNDLIDGLENE